MNQLFTKPDVTFKNFSPSREAIILSHCKGKKVLHIGACDWPFTQQKLQNNNLLYLQIDEVCQEQLGIDLNEESLAFLNDDHVFKNSNAISFDMNKVENIDFKPDVIVMGEVIEHLVNLEIALSNIAKAMSKDCTLIITTPNALDFRNFLNAFRSVEICHFDHKVIFTFKTLNQLLNHTGFTVEKTLFAFPFFPHYLKYKIPKKIISTLLTLPFYLFPIFASTLVSISRFREPVNLDS